jgi:hypothetical protein
VHQAETTRVIYPPLSEHSRLRQKLTTGELLVLKLFHKRLPADWEIYVQPYLNGLRPDFVLLNPRGGIGVFEVKDWNLDAMRYFTKQDATGIKTLWAEKDGKEFCCQRDNPLTKALLYKKEIYDLYCPRIASNAGWAAITAGVIFPYAPKSRVKQILSPFLTVQDGDQFAKYQPISGRDELLSEDLGAIFPEGRRRSSRLMSEDLAKDLRGWLVEPDFSSTQRAPLVLDRNQKLLADTRTSTGFRRIKGPAGSGKSLVLAARAARLADGGKSVLVATFNITLWHYLRDLIVRGLEQPSHLQNVRFTHFHLWCKHVCYAVGWDGKYESLWQDANCNDDVLHTGLPLLTLEALSQPGAPRYDAILVDEGQDYRPLWWNVLRQARAPEGEMLLVADATQDIYSQARAWTDEASKGAGFAGGRWAELSVSYRLPPDALKLARSFAEKYLPQDVIDLPNPDQDSLDLYPCHLKWVQCAPSDGERVCSDEIVSLMRETGQHGLANPDITVLASDMKGGGKLVSRLGEEYGIRTVNTFGPDHRRRKMGFYMGDARVKATTLHSFKGWETRLLLVHVTEAAHADSLALVYAALTRLKRSQQGSWLTVVCSATKLREFGQTFPTYREEEARAGSS